MASTAKFNISNENANKSNSVVTSSEPKPIELIQQHLNRQSNHVNFSFSFFSEKKNVNNLVENFSGKIVEFCEKSHGKILLVFRQQRIASHFPSRHFYPAKRNKSTMKFYFLHNTKDHQRLDRTSVRNGKLFKHQRSHFFFYCHSILVTTDWHWKLQRTKTKTKKQKNALRVNDVHVWTHPDVNDAISW